MCEGEKTATAGLLDDGEEDGRVRGGGGVATAKELIDGEIGRWGRQANIRRKGVFLPPFLRWSLFSSRVKQDYTGPSRLVTESLAKLTLPFSTAEFAIFFAARFFNRRHSPDRHKLRDLCFYKGTWEKKAPRAR